MRDIHKEIVEKLSGYLDGELSPEERADIKTHLDECVDCKAIYERMQSLESLASDAMPAIGEDLLDQLEHRITDEIAGLPESASESKSKKATVTPIWHRYVAIAASLVVITLAGRMALKESDHALKPQLKSPSSRQEESSQPVGLETKKAWPVKMRPDDGQTKSESRSTDNALVTDEMTESIILQKPKIPKFGAVTTVKGMRKGIDFNQTGTVKIGTAQPEAGQPGAVSSKTQQQVISVPIATVEDILSKETAIAQENESESRIRGGRSGETTYLVNGVKESDPVRGRASENIGISAETSYPVPIGSLKHLYANLFNISKDSYRKKSAVAPDILLPENLDVQQADNEGVLVIKQDKFLDSLGNLDSQRDAENIERLYLTMRRCIDLYNQTGNLEYATRYRLARDDALELLNRYVNNDDSLNIYQDYQREIQLLPEELK